MGTPINHTTLVAGGVVQASTLNNNFEAINTYLAGTGLENQYIENALHNWSMSWQMDSVHVGTGIIGFKVPSGFSSNGLSLVEAQLFVEDVGGAGAVNVNIHTAVAPSALNRIIPNDLSVNSNNTFDTDTDFSANSFGGTFSTGASVYIEYEVTGSTVAGVTVTLFAKAENRG